MYFNVIVRDAIEDSLYRKELTFTFYNINEALCFCKKMIIDQGYYVEILYFDDED